MEYFKKIKVKQWMVTTLVTDIIYGYVKKYYYFNTRAEACKFLYEQSLQGEYFLFKKASIKCVTIKKIVKESEIWK